MTTPPDKPDAQRAIEGPRAAEIFNERFVRSYARTPTFDETFLARDEIDRRVTQYFVKHPEVATSPRSQYFRLHRRVAVDMSKEEVTVLLGPPDATTTEEAAMQAGAKQFWPEVKMRAKEMWVYPAGWRLYFEGDRLVDITVLGKPPIE